MQSLPCTDKQQKMLAHQLHSSHDGSFDNNRLDRSLIEEIKRINAIAGFDRLDARDLISALIDFNCDPDDTILAKNTEAILRHILTRATH